jgi:hypothetical protein
MISSDPLSAGAEALTEAKAYLRIVGSGAMKTLWSNGCWGAHPLRQGVVRLAAHLYAERDGPELGGPPAAVTALWRPWRRMRLA